MARIKVRHLQTGKTGTIDEKDYRPDIFEIPETGAEKVYKAATAVPRFMFPESTEMLERLMESDPKLVGGKPGEWFMPIYMWNKRKELAPMAKEISVSMLLNEVGKWLGGKVMGKMKGVKGVTPKGLQAGLEESQKAVGNQVDDIIKQATKEKLSLGDVVAKIEKLKLSREIAGRPESVARVDEVVKSLKGLTGVSSIAGEATALGQDIWGEAGRELMARGAGGVAEKAAKKTAGGGLRDLLTKTVPEVAKPLARQQELSAMASQMTQPFKNWWMGGLAGSLLSPLAAQGVIPLGIAGAASIGTTLAAMPYTRYLGQKALGKAVEYGRYPLMGILNQLQYQPKEQELQNQYQPQY